jgi:glucose/mannose transport system permease protein
MRDDEIVLARGPGFYVARTFIYSCLIFAAAVYLFPLAVVLLTSLKDLDDVRTGSILSPPIHWTLQPWREAWFNACVGLRCTGLSGFFGNSFAMAIPAVVASTAIGAVNGYALTQWRFRGADLIFALLLFGAFIPYQIVLIPMARTLGFLNLANTIPGLILVHVVYGIPFTTLFFRNFMFSLPLDLVSAARVDGAGFFQILWRVIVPIAIPCFVVSIIWQFTNIWNDYIFGATFTSGDGMPLTIALNNIVNTTTGVKPYNVDMASVIITALPTLFIYIVAGRYFLRGLMAGSVKG